MRMGFRTGLALILPLNPAALVTWVVVVARMIPPASRIEGVFFAVGVFVGSWSWFSLVAYLTQRDEGGARRGRRRGSRGSSALR